MTKNILSRQTLLFDFGKAFDLYRSYHTPSNLYKLVSLGRFKTILSGVSTKKLYKKNAKTYSNKEVLTSDWLFSVASCMGVFPNLSVVILAPASSNHFT